MFKRAVRIGLTVCAVCGLALSAALLLRGHSPEPAVQLAKPEAAHEPTATVGPPTPVVPPPPDPVATTVPPAATLGQPESSPEQRVSVARLPLVPPLEPGAPAPAPQTSAHSGTWSQPVPLEQTSARAAPSPMPRPVRPIPEFPGTKAPVKVSPLTGSHPAVVDCEFGVVLPRAVQQQLGSPRPKSLYAVPGSDQSVWLYTADGLERVREQLSQSPKRTKARLIGRVCFSQAEPCPVDRSGRVVLPESMVHFAGLCQDAMVLGVGDHLEVWDATHWQDYLRRHEPARADAIPADRNQP